MVKKNKWQLIFEFVKIVVAKQHSTDSLSRSELLLNPFIPLLSILPFHMVEVPVMFSLVVEEIHEVIIYVPLQLHFKSFHGILFQLLFCPSRSPRRTSPRYQS